MQAPEICSLYALTVPPFHVRAAIRDQFEQHRHIQDLKVIDVLLLKARQEYQETMNCWKQVRSSLPVATRYLVSAFSLL